PGLHGRLELLAEALEVEVGKQRVLLRVGVCPGRERRYVDLGLGLREALGAGGVDPDRVRAARCLGLLPVPATCLVAAPGGSDGRECEKHGCQDVEALVGAAALWSHARVCTPSGLHGSRTFASRFGSTSSISRSDRFIATGWRPPTPPWNGLLS